jgi:hypothetical protein
MAAHRRFRVHGGRRGAIRRAFFTEVFASLSVSPSFVIRTSVACRRPLRSFVQAAGKREDRALILACCRPTG